MPKKNFKFPRYNPLKSTVFFTILNINQKLYSKYNSSQITYGIKKVDELIYIDSTLFSITFREFLLYDDPTEFFRRFYNKTELPKKLGKILFFYDKYSRIFPNYTVLSGSKYMYKNIQKKQKMIDNLQELKQQEAENKKHVASQVTILNNTAVNTILNESNSFCIKTLNMMFNINIGVKNNNENNSSLNDINKILIEINHAEERELHNRALSPKVVMQNSVTLKQEIDKIRFTSREHSSSHTKDNNRNEMDNNQISKNTISYNINSSLTSKSNQSNRLFSPKSPNFNILNMKNLSQNSLLNPNKIFLHKKTISQNVNQYITKKTGNTSVKNKILSLEKKTSEFVEHMKNIKKSDSTISSTKTNKTLRHLSSNNNSQNDYKESTRLTYNLSSIKSDSSHRKLSPTSSFGKLANIGNIKHGIPLDLSKITKQTHNVSKSNQLNLCLISTPRNSCFTERESSKKLTYVNNNVNNINKQKIEGRNNVFPSNYFFYSSKCSRTNSQEKTVGFPSPVYKRRNVVATTTTNKMKLSNCFIKRKNKKMFLKENNFALDKQNEFIKKMSCTKYVHK